MLLAGLRVIDVATYIAGPAAATVMSDFGADVIKVERPPLGDPYRYLSTVPGMPVSPELYCWILEARNKRSIALDLANPVGRAVLDRLVSGADVFLTNFQPQLRRKFRINDEDLRPLNPRLIYASVTGYGEHGEEAEKPGFDITAYWARSGLMSTIHNADAEPALSPAGFGDHPTSMALFAAIMMALYQRQSTGKGCKVSTSLMANGAWSNSCNLQAAFVNAAWPQRRTRRDPKNPLVNHYVTRDGKRFLLCLLVPDLDWIRLCRALNQPQWLDDPRFHTPDLRSQHAPQLVAMLDAVFAACDLEEWSRRFRLHEVTWALVPTTEEVAADSQMEANGVFVPLVDGPWHTVNSPIELEGVSKVPPRMAPSVGQHTRDILFELGYSDAEVAAFIHAKVAS